MTELNKNRGTLLFRNKLSEHGRSLTPGQQARLDALRSAFEGQVGVMPADEVYGAARLATAVLMVVLEDDPSLDDGQGIRLVQRVLEEYDAGKVQTVTVQRSVRASAGDAIVKKQGRELESELGPPEYATIHERMSWEAQQQALSELVGQGECQEGLHNTVEIGSEFKKHDLSVEGFRTRGYLPADYDTVANGTELRFEEDSSADSLGIVTLSDGIVERVQCPFCVARWGTTRENGDYVGTALYAISLSRMGCFDCDGEFDMEIDLDHQIAQGSGFWHGLTDDEEDDSLPEGFGDSIIIARA